MLTQKLAARTGRLVYTSYSLPEKFSVSSGQIEQSVFAKLRELQLLPSAGSAKGAVSQAKPQAQAEDAPAKEMAKVPAKKKKNRRRGKQGKK